MSHLLCKAALQLLCLVSAGTGVCACGGAATPSPQAPSEPPTPASIPLTQDTTLETPVLRCGPADSYSFVAKEYKCPDGTNPFEGSVMAARRSRLGSKGPNEQGHYVDIYRIPCSGGEKLLHVDMYGCPEMESKLDLGPEVTRIAGLYEQRSYQKVIQDCDPDRWDEVQNRAAICMTVLPAAAFMISGEPSNSLQLMQAICDKLPKGSEHSTIRAELIMSTLEMVGQGLLREGASMNQAQEKVRELSPRFAATCSIPVESLTRPGH